MRAEAILVASRSLSATFVCVFLYFSVDHTLAVALLAEPRPAQTRPREQNLRPRAVWLASRLASWVTLNAPPVTEDC